MRIFFVFICLILTDCDIMNVLDYVYLNFSFDFRRFLNLFFKFANTKIKTTMGEL